MIVGGVNILGVLSANRLQRVHGNPSILIPKRGPGTISNRNEGDGAMVPSAVTEPAKRRWWQRPPPEERAVNRERMREEIASDFIQYGSWAWMALYGNKFSWAAKILFELTPIVGDGQGVTTGKDYTDYDPQGA